MHLWFEVSESCSLKENLERVSILQIYLLICTGHLNLSEDEQPLPYQFDCLPDKSIDPVDSRTHSSVLTYSKTAPVAFAASRQNRSNPKLKKKQQLKRDA